MKTKSKKTALLMSFTSLLICFAMLVGSTFAWFTDTASTGVNQIKSGTLKVDILDPAGKSLRGGALKWTQKTSAEGAAAAVDEEGLPLWEPGVTFLTETFRIANKGNLALKYKLALNGVTGNTELLDVIEFSVEDEAGKAVDLNTFEGHLAPDTVSKTMYIKGHMDEQAGNDYQKKILEGIGITVYATQDTVENDSLNNQYDKDAKNPEVKTATDAASLDAVITDLAIAGDKNVVVSVAKDMDNTSGIKTAKGNTLTMDFNGKTVGVSYGKGSTGTTTNGMQLLQGSTVTLKNGIYKANHGEDKDHNIAILIQNYSNLTIENCTLDMREANDTAGNSKGSSYAISTNCGKVVIKGKTDIYARSGEYALDVMHWENTSYKEEGTSVTFDETMTGTVDGKIDVYCYRNGKVVQPVDDGGAMLTIMGGTFKNSGLSLEEFKKFVPAGYSVTENNDGSFTVGK